MIGWEEVLVNDLFSIERDIKPQVTQLTVSFTMLVESDFV